MTLERMLLKSDGDYTELLARLKKRARYWTEDAYPPDSYPAMAIWCSSGAEGDLALDYVETKEFE